MSTVDEQPYMADKIMKRGYSVTRETPPNKVIPRGQIDVPVCISSPASLNEAKSTRLLRLRLWRGCEDWTSKNYILSIVSLLSIFALSGSFMFAYSLRDSRELTEENDINSYPKLGLSDHDSWPFRSAWERSGLLGEKDSGRSTLGSSRSVLDSVDNTTDNDRGVSSNAGDRSVASGCDVKSAKLKLYMYDLLPEFHYGMLVEQDYAGGQIWPTNVTNIPHYLGGLYQQHSPEYWLTSDLLTSSMAGRQSPCTAFRVSDWKDADLIFVPFFASLAYNKYTKSEHKAGFGELDLVGDNNQKLQEKLLKYLRQQPAWQASSGSDHILVIHHPNSMHAMRDAFRNVMYVVADFGRYTPKVANVDKDIVAPYKHVIPSFDDDSASFEDRKTLLFFQGTIVRKQGGIIRQLLYEMLKGEKGVHFEEGSSGSAGIHSATSGMRGSKFCLNIAGDTPSSNRLFDAIASHCIPVIISDDIERVRAGDSGWKPSSSPPALLSAWPRVALCKAGPAREPPRLRATTTIRPRPVLGELLISATPVPLSSCNLRARASPPPLHWRAFATGSGECECASASYIRVRKTREKSCWCALSVVHEQACRRGT